MKVLIVDCQTTGAGPAFGRVLEIGWGVACAGSPEPQFAQAHWVTLPEGHVVPSQVRKLTGYDANASRSEISESEAWRRLRNALSSTETGSLDSAGTLVPGASLPTAIHFARFELPFLRDWSQRF
ncbi:MAG TPA: hypothetical protein VFQ61_16375, partial [Polyangiaceae bacterium]|nr:hypothetical protein [Polyangiaceae bacterium]